MRLLPDTNVLVYDTVEDSMHHDKAVKIIDAAGELAIPPIVIHEYV
ncbi:MAG: PIN domain-containing protein [Candidatus Caldarchaeum sp.]